MSKLIVNVETGEETVRELTQAEKDQENIDAANFKAKFEAEKVGAEAKASNKAALLSKLGITAEEAAILLS